jgi:peptidylprolyl isomerase
MAGIVKKGDTVRVHYTGKLEDGKEFDSSLKRQPLQFEVGAGSVIKGFEDAVVGLKQGEKKSVTIPPDDAYGSYDENLLVEMPKTSLPEGVNPEVGTRLQIVNQQGHALPVVVTDILDESIKLDANHPLAGKTLLFDIEVVEIL